MIDSTNIHQVIETAVLLGTQITKQTPFIPGLPNPLLSSLLTVIGGVIIRFFERRRMKKKAKNDE